jgi:hypothetical protein
MKFIVKSLVGLIFIAIAVIQFIRPNLSNPPVTESKRIEHSIEIPSDVQAILNRSCKDCHSNETIYPWYSNVQPIGWFVTDHVEEGRRELNFSEWGGYSDSRKRRKLKQICEQAESGEMPLPSYLIMHPNAKLSVNDVKILCEWTEKEIQRIPEEK